MFSVYQHWDPLRVCVVGKSYPPDFYSWIKNPKLRNLFERIATETEEDFQNIIRVLKSFGVRVLRPELPVDCFINGAYKKPPMTPRDHMIMIGDVFYETISTNFSKLFYNDIKDSSWPECNNWQEFNQLPSRVKNECIEIFGFGANQIYNHEYDQIFSYIKQHGNIVKIGKSYVNGAMTARIGKDLYFGTDSIYVDQNKLLTQINSEFTNTRNHVINTGGHSDCTYCPVCPGLIISLFDVPTYKDTFPGWEVVYLPNQSWSAVKPFLDLKRKNKGKWWIPGYEYDDELIQLVETWLGHWVGYVEETVFDVNMLIIDPKNVMVFNYNQQVFDALARYGITSHVVPFRHRYFWDGGIHCVTSDLHRDGVMQDFFK
jgi:hypothetical protein